MKTINSHLLWAIPLLIASIYYGVLRDDVNILIPGGITPIEEKVYIDSGYEQEGTFSSVFVYSIEKATRLQQHLGTLLPGVDSLQLSEAQASMTVQEMRRRGEILFETGVEYSLINAYTSAEKPLDVDFNGLYITYVGNHDLSVEIGHLVSAVDGVTFSNYGEFLLLIDGKDDVVVTTDEGDFEISRGENGLFGLYFRVDYELSNAYPSFEILDSTTHGSSGGLLQTLSLYNALIPEDITNGLHIAGTGTINELGFVGEIGGVKQKVIAAAKEGVDVFFVPHINFAEAEKELAKIESNMELVSVADFTEALTFLESVGDSNG